LPARALLPPDGDGGGVGGGTGGTGGGTGGVGGGTGGSGGGSTPKIDRY
tara:strand:- start:318 stop:464 length:147 start_codon:yes stop_codon:yes gene_type:complete